MSSAQIHTNELQKKIESVRQPGRELLRQQEQGPVQDVTPQVAYRRIQFNRDGLRPADLLALQRAVGNRAVQRMLAKANDEQQDETAEEDAASTVQTKLTAGAPDGVHTQEADRVADQVMTMPDAAAQRPNRTGLPDGLKSGVESLSGISLDGVNVHYNSSQPAQLNALAYTQGSDIHVAPGQEQHLQHEAWHAVQQAQDRVKPTMQMKDGLAINDDVGLEREADVMGAKAWASGQVLADLRSQEHLADQAQGAAGLSRTLTPPAVQAKACLQAMGWTYINGQWYPDGETTNAPPAHVGKNGEYFDDGLDVVAGQDIEEPVGPDPYAAKETVNGAIIDYPALRKVMANVEKGVVVQPDVWQKMRADLSKAITLPNKSHPAHGSNFNKKQRPEQQIVDWAAVIPDNIRVKLAKFFSTEYGIAL
jgi:hypothetical protein